ncbi:MAG: hypothetical protein JSV41_08960 [Gemmatimonadota bacterium]|nr:MAG: hypothetical protein JSV41_08960 [Gemmatimonadota bacterium]
MFRFGRRFRGLCAVVLAIFLVACEEFSTEALLRVDIQQAAPWPDTLDLAEIANLTVEILDPQGRAITGVEVDWGTSDSMVFQLSSLAPPEAGTRRDSLEAELTAVVSTHEAGSAEIIARIDRSGFEPAELRVPLVVVRRGWPDLVTVTAVDTVGIAVEHADRTLTGNLDAEWGSSDPATLKVKQLDADPLRATVTGYASGTAEIVIAVESERLDPTVFRVPIAVSAMRVLAAGPWPDSINVTNIDTVEVEIRDALGTPIAGVEVQWRSSNEVALAVDPLDGYRAEVRALARGGADVIATVGGQEFQTAEYRRSIRVLQKWRSVDAGYMHTCALAVDGTAYCWGRNTEGELGAGHYADRSVPERVATFMKFDEIEAGGVPFGDVYWEQAHTCGEFGRRVFCWGSYKTDQLGDGSGPCTPGLTESDCGQAIPVEAVEVSGRGGLGAYSVRVGGRHTCAGMVSDFPVGHCWGLIDSGIAGTDHSTGGGHVCSYFVQSYVGTVCKGLNGRGQLGDGTTVDRLGPDDWGLPVLDASGDTLDAKPSAGGEHTCAIESITRRAWCWGSNSAGQLGTTAATSICDGVPCSVWAVPVQQLDIDVDSITAGFEHTCALTAGDAYCWGSNSSGQLGNSTVQQSSAVPVPVDGGHVFISISAGGAHTCGVTADGSIYCWGSKDHGQLGNGSMIDEGTPVRVFEPPS